MNHSATHLLQKALQTVLGDEVKQQGSYQDGERTRFDFSFSRAVTPEELNRVEDLVNEKIMEDIPVVTDVMSIDEAKKSGAMALFGEKYGEVVRVVKMGDFSKELCGGTHVKKTGDIHAFKIMSESGIAAGVRRVEGLTGIRVLTYYKGVEDMADSAVILKVIAKVKEEDRFQATRDMKRSIYMFLNNNAITVPYPQLTITQGPNPADHPEWVDKEKEEQKAAKEAVKQQEESKDMEHVNDVH